MFLLKVNLNTGDMRKANRRLKRIRRLPEMTSDAMMEWGKILEGDMKTVAWQKGIKSFTGTLYEEGIRWEQRPKGYTGRLFMRLYALALDAAPLGGKWISVKPSRTHLVAWARQAIDGDLRRKALLVQKGKLKYFSLKVRGHPFIMDGWRRARPKLRPIIAKYAKRTIGG